jgi:anthranilate synthase component 2
MILMIDNYDSFTYNLMQELSEVGVLAVAVVRNDASTVPELLALKPEAIVISPGPGVPEDAGVTMELVKTAVDYPLLGICLGHQALAAVHGGRVVRALEPVHGKTSPIHHDGEGLFEGLPAPLEATRYHSLIVDRDSLPKSLAVTAWTADGTVMGLRHRTQPHYGVQFHPESYLCQHGRHLLARFLHLAGLPVRNGWLEIRNPKPEVRNQTSS